MKEVLAFIEKISQRLSALSWLGGFILVFLGFFDIGNFKSVALRGRPTWGPLAVGLILLALGYVLKLLEPARSDFEAIITVGLLYVLRHVDVVGDFRPGNYFGNAVFHFNNPEAPPAPPHGAGAAWSKASEYAVRCLFALGLVEQRGGEYAISKLGRETLASNKIRAKYSLAFQKQPVPL